MEIINKFFVDLLTKTVDKLPHYPIDEYFHLQHISIEQDFTFTFKLITFKYVINSIDKTRNTNSLDPNDLNTKLLKTIKNLIISPLPKFFNDCATTNKYIQALKLSKVVPIYKGGESTDLNNYRPISIPPSIPKIFKNILSLQIIEYFEVNDLFFSGPFGFRRNKSAAKEI